MSPPRPWSSVAFQVALRYGALIVLTVAVVLGMFYIQVLGTLRVRIDHDIDVNLKRLQQMARHQGLDGLAAETERLLRDGVNSDTEVLIVTDRQGKALLGNAQLKHPRRLSTLGDRELDIKRHGATHVARVHVAELEGGNLLIVGNDMRPLDELGHLFISASVWTMLSSGLIIVFGSLGFRKMVEARASTIRHTMAEVAAGQLTARIPTQANQRDEFTLMYRDINHMLDQLQVLMDGIRNVSNTIAHNLRTPLTRIRLRLEDIRHQPVSPTLAHALDDFSEELLHISTMFERLLAIAEVEAGALRLQFEPVQLRSLMLEAMDLYEPLVDEEGGQLVLSVEGEPICLGDPNLLASAISNLIENAVKHGRSADGHLRLRLHAGAATHATLGRAIALSVCDQGPGVDAQHLSRLGQRFFRGAANAPGHGLGLASVQAIAQVHAGLLEFESSGHGLCVRLWLPLAGSEP